MVHTAFQDRFSMIFPGVFQSKSHFSRVKYNFSSDFRLFFCGGSGLHFELPNRVIGNSYDKSRISFLLASSVQCVLKGILSRRLARMDPSKNLFGGGLHGPAGQNVDVAAAIATF